jgi:cytoskeletal protein RodZ
MQWRRSVSIGDALVQARSQAGLTVTQVSQRTCIRETIIRGIERGDFSACGGDFYARGHIRSIARVVGIDPEPLIHEYDATHGAPQAIRAADVFEPATPIKIKDRRSPNWSVAMIIVLALVLGYGAYRVVRAVASPHPATPAAAAQGGHRPAKSTTPSPVPSPTPTHASHTVVIHLTAIEDCWVEFTRPDGAFMSQAYVIAGGMRTWTFHHTVSMQIGNPGGILLNVNGKNRNLGPQGAAGPVTLTLGPGTKLAAQAAG